MPRDGSVITAKAAQSSWNNNNTTSALNNEWQELNIVLKNFSYFIENGALKKNVGLVNLISAEVSSYKITAVNLSNITESIFYPSVLID